MNITRRSLFHWLIRLTIDVKLDTIIITIMIIIIIIIIIIIGNKLLYNYCN